MAEYTFGTHAKALSDAEAVKTKVWGPALSKAGLLGVMLVVGQQAYSDVQPAVRQSVGAGTTAPPQSRISASPQVIDLTLGAKIYQVSAAPISVSNPITRYFTAAPQSVDLTLQAQNWEPPPQLHGILGAQVVLGPQLADFTIQARLYAPQPNPQGPLGVQVFAFPTDTSQLAPQVWASLVPPPVIPNPVAPYYKTYPQFEERPTVAVWPAQVAGLAPSVIPQLQAAPQSVDLAVRPAVWGPVVSAQGPTISGYVSAPIQVDYTLQAQIRTPGPAAQGVLGSQVWAGQQTRDYTQSAQYYVPSYTLIIVTGPTVRPNAFVPGQYDLTVNGTQIWTPSTLRKFTPPVVGPNPIEIGLGLSLMRLGGKAF